MKKKLALVLSLFFALASYTTLSACTGSENGASSGSERTVSKVSGTAAESSADGASTNNSIEPSAESLTEPSVDSSVEAPSEPSAESSAEASVEPSEQQSQTETASNTPEELLSLYETEINGLLKNNTPLDSSLIETVFEYHYLRPEYNSTLDGALDSLNSALMSVFEKADFINKYGAIPDEVFEYDGFTTVGLSDLKIGTMTKYFNMPEIEEIRLYNIDIYMSIGTQKKKWTTTKWYFIKTGGKWYLDYNDTDISI